MATQHAPTPAPTPTPSPAVSHTYQGTSGLPVASFANAPYLKVLLETISKPAGEHAPLQHFQPLADPVPSPTPAAAAPRGDTHDVAASLVGILPAAGTPPSTPPGAGPPSHRIARDGASLPTGSSGRQVAAIVALLMTGIVGIALTAGAGAARLVRRPVRPRRPSRLRTLVALPLLAIGWVVAMAPAGSTTPGPSAGRPSARALIPFGHQPAALPGPSSQAVLHPGLVGIVDIPPPAPRIIGAVLSPVSAALAAPEWRQLVGIETEIKQTQAAAVGGGSKGTTLSDRVTAALRQEEALYTQAASDPAIATALVAAAGASGNAEAAVAVPTDISIMRAVLAHEGAVSAAEHALLSVGDLTPAQLTAISAKAPFISPLAGALTQQFGPSGLGIEPAFVEQGVLYPHFHTGLDIAAPSGTPIHAAADGTVLSAGASTDGAGHLVGYGQYIVIAHPQGFVTLYGHLSGLSVHAGDAVRQGEIIGAEGSTGNSTGPHLHFEVRSGGDPINPLPFISGQLS